MNARIQAPSRPVILRAGFLGVLAILIGLAVLAAAVDFSPDAEDSSTGATQGISREGSLDLRSSSEASRLADPAAAERAGTAATLRGRAEVERQLSSSSLGADAAVRRPHGFSAEGQGVYDGWVGPPHEDSNEPVYDGWVGQRVERSDSLASPSPRRPE